MSDPADQLALAVDPRVELDVCERRADDLRELRVGPLAEPAARDLAGLLLSRPGPVDGDGPWRCAVAGGSRTVALVRAGRAG